MSRPIYWYRVYNGRVRHAFDDTRKERGLTVCGKRFDYIYDGRYELDVIGIVPRCKKCVALLTAEEQEDDE